MWEPRRLTNPWASMVSYRDITLPSFSPYLLFPPVCSSPISSIPQPSPFYFSSAFSLFTLSHPFSYLLHLRPLPLLFSSPPFTFSLHRTNEKILWSWQNGSSDFEVFTRSELLLNKKNRNSKCLCVCVCMWPWPAHERLFRFYSHSAFKYSSIIGQCVAHIVTWWSVTIEGFWTDDLIYGTE
jgi:hypothetical protein